MAENQLSPKEQYEREREVRRRERGSNPSSGEPAIGGRTWWPWLLVLLVLAGMVFGLYKLATLTPPGSGPASGLLVDPVKPTDWTAGNKEAKIQLVEYSDFQCPACGFYAPWIKRLHTELPKELGVTYRHFPLRTIHSNAQVAAQVAEAAGLQGRFWESVDIIFDHQKDWSEQIAPRETLYNLVRNVGVNIEKLKRDVDSTVVKNKIERDFQSGLRSKVEGTPTFFLNGQKIENPKSYDDFKQLIVTASAV